MAQNILALLDNEIGSSRQEILECFKIKYPEMDEKRMLAYLKKLPTSGSDCKKKPSDFIEKSKDGKRFQLEVGFIKKYKKAMKEGATMQKALELANKKDAIEIESSGKVSKANASAKQKKPEMKPKSSEKSVTKTSYFWTNEEHLTFIFNFHTYGKHWKLISENQPDRDSLKCRTHGQKYL